MSHKDYCAALDEDQLSSLIEHANSRINSLKSEGWETLWVVCDSWSNLAWFHESEHAKALEKMIELAKKNSSPDKPCEWGIQFERVRPSEALVLLGKDHKS